MKPEFLDKILGEVVVETWKNRVLRRNTINTDEIRKPLYFSLGAECLDNGALGLRTLTRALVRSHRDGPLFVGTELFNSLHKSDQDRFLDEYAKVGAGIILMGAEYILAGEIDRFSELTFCNWHNNAVDKTFVPSLTPGRNYPYPTPQDREAMLKANKEDETNLSLVSEKLRALPLFTQETVYLMGIVPALERTVSPFLVKVAAELKPFQQARNQIFPLRNSLVPKTL